MTTIRTPTSSWSYLASAAALPLRSTMLLGRGQAPFAAAVACAAVQTMLAALTTMRVGGPASEFEVARTSEQLVALIRGADAEGKPVLVMGGGSNLVVGDQGFKGLVVKVATSRMKIHAEDLTVDAGVEWDTVVETSLDAGLAGLEPLSGIPGTAGGTPVQNVGAYGALTSELLHHLTVYDRLTGAVERWAPDRCGFGSHRQSVFKHTDRYVVLDVTFHLTRSTQSDPIHYTALAERLAIAPSATAPTRQVREAVLALRRERGMILDADDHDTWSVGSFFINPVLTFVPDKARHCPQYPDPAGIKLSAAWLIDHAGFPRGYGRDRNRGAVALSSKHTLAVTNRGTATTAEVMEFAAHIRDGVEQRFDIRLGPECDLVNCKFG
ncbi:MAG TPA: UDP-N-acetylmuramate dehydrogenase [Pseudonocardiaceae bacterium]|nr:UDP-N-acetylmuramate dehydrogenase [Pseudonocardiaceae bacterium]